jgi:long-chain-acyl-CoA dehydrogenase
MCRSVLNADHEAFRKTVRSFIEAEVLPVYGQWYAAGIVPREFAYKLAKFGLFGIEVGEQYGGAGIASFKFAAIVSEETPRVTLGGLGHTFICVYRI